nr:hypothetical protein [Tanacetum cinerariifolium]
MSSHEVIVNRYFGMPMDPLDPYVHLGPEAPPSPDYILGPEYPEYLLPADDVLPAEEQPLPATVSPTVESPGYIKDSEPEMEPEEEDGDDEKSEGNSIDYPTNRGDDDITCHTYTITISSFTYIISITPFLIPLPIFTPPPPPPSIILPRTRASMVLIRSATPSTFILAPRSRTPPIGTPPLLPIPLPTTSFPLPLLLSSTSGCESIPEANILLQKRTRFTTPTGGYEVGESSVAAAGRQIRPTLTIADSRRAEDRLIGRLRRERRYFHTLSTTYAQEVAHSHDYCTQIMGYCQSQEIHTSTLVP